MILAENLLAKLEGGAEARLFASGLAACAAIIGTIKAGEHILAPRIMYHGAQDLIRITTEKHNAEASFFDAADPTSLRAAIRPNTCMVWIESPINPTWDIIDIADAARAAHEVGAILCIVSSVTTRALDQGADIVFHSATKYLNGHSDVLGGVLITKVTAKLSI